MDLVITIDTEEDNWARYSTTDNPVSNIEKLIPLQQMFDRYQVRPTYLITYPVATNPRSVEILKSFSDEGKCEIGTHCHPWNTPPFEENINEFNSMLCNLPEDLVLKKLTSLHQAICNNFGIIPTSFRSGRWGFNSAVARSLVKLGYKVDSSVTPFVSWIEYDGPDFHDFPLHPYRFDPDEISVPCGEGSLLQVPATIGFLQNYFKCGRYVTKMVETGVGRKMRLKGIFDRMGLLNKIWLSPEHTNIEDLVSLSSQIENLGFTSLNMTFHSTTLTHCLSSFSLKEKDTIVFFDRIKKYLDFAAIKNYKNRTLSQIIL